MKPITALLCLAAAVTAQAPAAPWYIDDDKFLDSFAAKIDKAGRAGRCLKPEEIAKKIAADGRADLQLTAPGDKPLTPEEVYTKAVASTFVIGCVKPAAKAGGEFEQGWFATAWAATADGVLVTNRHVFEKPDGMAFAAANARGEVFPLTDILAVNRKADVAIIKVDGKGFAPLPVAAGPAAVGAWVGVLSHPGHQLFTFTQGTVTRYTRNFGGAAGEKWMGLSADYAGGSSGGPVLNKFGAVVGMAALTSNIDYEADEKPPADAKPKPAEVQMIVKLAVPAALIRKTATPPTVK